jgi:hypothetical protein
VDGENVKVANPTSEIADNAQWVIYPKLKNNEFTFVIKNCGTEKYIKTNRTESYAQIDGIQNDDQSKNELIATRSGTCADVTQQADTIHNCYLKEQTHSLVLKSVVDDEPKNGGKRNDHKKYDHFRDIKIYKLVLGKEIDALLKNRNDRNKQDEKFQCCMDVLTFGTLIRGYLMHIKPPHISQSQQTPKKTSAKLPLALVASLLNDYLSCKEAGSSG